MGTTAGMMIANIPAVLLGETAAKKLPVRMVHGTAAFLFLLLGIAVLFGMNIGF
jgi:putative Ca2+/H+ antiporter (TMEM165/GDT1 family)